MKYTLLITTFALSLTLPAHAMNNNNNAIAALKKLNVLHRKTVKLVCDSALIVADSSLENSEKEVLLDDNFGLFPGAINSLNEIAEFLAQTMFERKMIQEKQKIWFFNPKDFKEPEETDPRKILSRALALQQDIDAQLKELQ